MTVIREIGDEMGEIYLEGRRGWQIISSEHTNIHNFKYDSKLTEIKFLYKKTNEYFGKEQNYDLFTYKEPRTKDI